DGRRRGEAFFIGTLARILAERRCRYDSLMEVEGLGRASIVFVSNDRTYTFGVGLPLRFSPRARFELGLDVVAPVRVTPALLAGYLARLTIGMGMADAPGVVSGHDLDRIVVRASEPLPLQADGEDLGDVTEAVFEAERGAVDVL